MEKVISLMFMLAVSASLWAQHTARSFEWKNSADGESVVYAYLPASSQATGRAVVDCPGGGYTHLAMQKEGTDWAEYFNKKGIAYLVLKYRMPHGDRNIPLSDAYHAMKTVRDSAAVWNINPSDVGIMGFSAGGHLASTVSTHADLPVRPNFSILFYPVISMDEKVTHKGSVNGFLGSGKTDPSLVRAFSNDKQVSSHATPPAIILLANDDQAVYPPTNGVAYYTAMRGKGNQASLYVYPEGGHGFGFNPSFPYHQQMLDDLATWLRTLSAPQKDAIRVACIGNSITFGSCIDMNDVLGYPAQLQKLLGSGYFVRNFGIGASCMASTSEKPYMKLRAWKDAKDFNPNLVVIKLGTNDSKPQNWNPDDYRRTYQAMIDTLKSLPAHPKIYLAYPIKAFKVQWGINDSTIVNGVIPIIQKLAKKNKLPVIDLHAVVTDPNLIVADGIHPNAKGAAVIAKAVGEAIKK